MEFNKPIVDIICNKQHSLSMSKPIQLQLPLHPNLTLPTIISIMLTPHKLQTNMVEMVEEARTFISRQPIMEEKVEKVVVEAELNYPINLTMIDKLQ